MPVKKFDLGRTVITAAAQSAIDPMDVLTALARHHCGDWGEVGEADRQENELSVANGFRIFSVYRDRAQKKFYIITEWDRSATTIMLPEDY